MGFRCLLLGGFVGNRVCGYVTDNPTLSPQRQPEDQGAALRLKSLGEFVGQEAARRLEPLSKGIIRPSWAK